MFDACAIVLVLYLPTWVKGSANMPMNNDARTRWNAKKYKQVKVFVNPDIAADFKATCAAHSESMAAVISQAMLDYCGKKTNVNKLSGHRK